MGNVRARYVKFSVQERVKLMDAIKTAHRQGFIGRALLGELRRVGVSNPDGTTPIRCNTVASTLRIMEAGGYRIPKTGKVTHDAGFTVESVLGILTDPKLSDDKKIRVLTAYLE